MCPETSVLPTVAKLEVYLADTAGVLDPKAAATDETQWSAIFDDQECFRGCRDILLQGRLAASEEGDVSFMFVSFVDGEIVGGRFPSHTKHRSMQVGWAGSEYYKIARGRIKTMRLLQS